MLSISNGGCKHPISYSSSVSTQPIHTAEPTAYGLMDSECHGSGRILSINDPSTLVVKSCDNDRCCQYRRSERNPTSLTHKHAIIPIQLFWMVLGPGLFLVGPFGPGYRPELLYFSGPPLERCGERRGDIIFKPLFWAGDTRLLLFKCRTTADGRSSSLDCCKHFCIVPDFLPDE